MTGRLTISIALINGISIVLCAAGEPVKPRVALIYSDYGNYRHADDYDGAMRRLGWTMDGYENTDLDTLLGRISDYDIVIGSALFNYSNVQDFGSHAAEWLRAAEGGVALIFTDINYPSHVNWFGSLGPGLGVSLHPHDGAHAPMSWLDRGHPLFNIPHRLRNTGATCSTPASGTG